MLPKDPRIGCDGDGWFVLVNKEPSYPHFFHLLSHTEIKSVLIKGDLDIRYIGFGDQSKMSRQFWDFVSTTTNGVGVQSVTQSQIFVFIIIVQKICLGHV